MAPTDYFKHLNYTMGDEDSSVELQLLKPNTHHVVAVAGSGGRVAPLLARYPQRLACVDVSEHQLALAEFRVAALRMLSRADYLGLLGYQSMPGPERTSLFRALSISDSARTLLTPLFGTGAAGQPLVYQGRFERMLRTLARTNDLFTGARGRRIFASRDLAEQQAYLDTDFPGRAWDLVLLLLGNSAVLNSLLYRGAFPKKNRPGSTYAIYKSIFDRLFRTILARRSFFLQMVFLGELQFADGFPIECDALIYEDAQRAARECRVDFVRGDVIEYLGRCRGVGFVSLSDVPSFLPAPADRTFLGRIRAGLADGAVVATRGHLRVVEPATDGYADISRMYEDVMSRETTQLWHVDIYEKN
jgi:S-adenosylmethionine-diacylglycerol 3-amino-3-carboxypropyl transferase